MKTKWKTIGSLLLMLVIGYMIGTFSTNIVSNRHYDKMAGMKHRDGFFYVFNQFLDLSGDQRVIVKEILDSHHERFNQVNEDHILAIKQVIDSLKTEIKPHLTADQLKIMNRIMDRDHRRGKGKRPHGPHPFPHHRKDGGKFPRTE